MTAVPISQSFADRLGAVVQALAARVATPFYVYDEGGMVRAHRAVEEAFRGLDHRQYFAVKALPNPAVLAALFAAGSGLDCSSPIELELAERCGARGEDVVFTSSNTSRGELLAAQALGAIVTFDDERYLHRLAELPARVCFRLAPAAADARSALVGGEEDSKFGMPPERLLGAYARAQAAGVRRFGIYGMSCANELDAGHAIAAARRLLDTAQAIERELGIAFEYVNLGGGLGIPYVPGERPFDVARYGAALRDVFASAFGGRRVKVLTEFGRYITGPHGVVVSRVVSRTRKHRELIGLDASMATLIRPALYGAYHHVSFPFTSGAPVEPADVVGSMCENGDRFASARPLPLPEEGDLAYIHDAGAHGHAMGLVYNGRLRPGEILLRVDGRLDLVRRAETAADHFATCVDPPHTIMALPVPEACGS